MDRISCLSNSSLFLLFEFVIQPASLCSSDFSCDMWRLLQLHEEEDDATSILAAPYSSKLQLNENTLEAANPSSFQEVIPPNEMRKVLPNDSS